MRSTPRFLAAVSRSQPSRLKKPAVGLDHFIQRGRVLAFWREVVRALNKIPPSSTRNELHNYARTEFERHREVSDLQHIRYLLSVWIIPYVSALLRFANDSKTGKAEFETMRRYIDEQAAG